MSKINLSPEEIEKLEDRVAELLEQIYTNRRDPKIEAALKRLAEVEIDYPTLMKYYKELEDKEQISFGKITPAESQKRKVASTVPDGTC